MDYSRVTGVIWWRMRSSHFKAIFRRGNSHGYTKDFLQAPHSIRRVLHEMYPGMQMPIAPIIYRWPGEQFVGGKIYQAPDRLEVGQWTQGAPHPWQLGDPQADPLITLPGDPNATIPHEADTQWAALAPLQPWLVMVQLDHEPRTLHLRAYLAEPPDALASSALASIPAQIRAGMLDTGGIALGLPAIWFDPDDFRAPWHLTGSSIEVGQLPPLARPSNIENIGTNYRPADEDATSAAPEPFEVDPDERDRGTRAHARTQNLLAAAVMKRGLKPLSPTAGINFDLAWQERNGPLVVAEVKSITPTNQERQLRLALGQVLRYRYQLGPSFPTRALIVTSDHINDVSWHDLLKHLDVGLLSSQELGDQLDRWLSEDTSWSTGEPRQEE